MSEPIINKRANYAFEILERFEAGLVLTGAEVKSIRTGKVSFQGSHITVDQERPILLNLNITPYQYAHDRQVNPKRPRALLLHQKEINRLRGLINEKKLTAIPLKVYFKNNRAKVEIAVVKGKGQRDRRESLRKETQERDIALALKGRL